MHDNDKSSSPKPWSRLMLLTVVGCFLIATTVALTADLNGNIIIKPNGSFPDVLSPAPFLIMLTTLIAGALIAITHAVRFRARRRLWLGIFLLFVIFIVVATLPAL